MIAPNLVLLVAVAVLVAAGVYLLLERSLSRVIVGAVLVGNGVNLLVLVAGGAAGRPPIVGLSDEPMADPLPQAMVLTAIVITLGLTAFLLAMAYRTWQLERHDEVQDDVEDRRIALLAARDRRALEDADTEGDSSLDEEAAQAHDETAAGQPAGQPAGVSPGEPAGAPDEGTPS